MKHLPILGAKAARSAQAFAVDYRGAAIIEYALLLAILSMTALAAYDYMGGGMTGFYGSVGESLNAVPN